MGPFIHPRLVTLVTCQWFVWQEMYMPTLKSMQIWPENFQDANDFWSASENGFWWWDDFFSSAKKPWRVFNTWWTPEVSSLEIGDGPELGKPIFFFLFRPLNFWGCISYFRHDPLFFDVYAFFLAMSYISYGYHLSHPSFLSEFNLSQCWKNWVVKPLAGMICRNLAGRSGEDSLTHHLPSFVEGM